MSTDAQVVAKRFLGLFLCQNMAYNNKNEKYLRDFFEHAPIGFHAFGPDQTIVDVNETELNLLGFEREEVVGKKTWSDLIVPENRVQFEQHWQDILQYGRVINLEYTMVCKDGKMVQVLLNATARFNRRGRLINTRGSIIDITQRKAMEDKLQCDQKIMKNNIRSLRKMIKGMQQEKSELRESFQGFVERRISPLVSKIKERSTADKGKIVSTLERTLAEITNGIGSKAYSHKWNLSIREIEICFLVQSGLTTKEISELLFSSTRTIDNHRNHIRKKLGISNQSVDLGEYLKSL